MKQHNYRFPLASNHANLVFAALILMSLACVCPTPPDSAKPSSTNGNSDLKPRSEDSVKSTSDQAVSEAEKTGLKLVSAKWQKGGFGAIAIWKVTIQNTSDKRLGNIKFRTAYFSETDRKVGRGGTDSLLGKDTIEKLVEPGKKRTFEVNDGFVSEEAETGTFELVSWEVIN